MIIRSLLGKRATRVAYRRIIVEKIR